MAHSDRKRAKRGWGLPKEPSMLCGTVHQHLNGYVLAAGAAGVAILACSVPAEGSPICHQIGFTLLGTDTYSLNPAGGLVAPFNIAQTFSSPSTHSSFAFGRLFLTPNFPRAEMAIAENDLPADLPAGASIGPGGAFGKGQSYGMLFSTNRFYHRGNLKPGRINYFGYRFLISGKIHYGWVRMTESGNYMGSQTQILASGYESTPDTAIAAGSCTSVSPSTSAVPAPHNGTSVSSSDQAGSSASAASPTSDTSQPASLGMLALGVQGLPLWRRYRVVNAAG
jgi:hypothetical protein